MGGVGDPVTQEPGDLGDIPGAVLEEAHDPQPLGMSEGAEQPGAASGLEGILSHDLSRPNGSLPHKTPPRRGGLVSLVRRDRDGTAPGACTL